MRVVLTPGGAFQRSAAEAVHRPGSISESKTHPDILDAVALLVSKTQHDHAQKIWELCPTIAAAIEVEYAELLRDGISPHHHDFAHAKRVAQTAYTVAKDEWGDEHLAKLAGIAGLVHNADRIIQAKKKIGRRDVARDDVIALVKKWIENDLEDADVAVVLDAVLGHDGKNSDQDSRVKIALQDGDRIVNLDNDLFPRSGQYYSDLPVVDYKHFLNNPQATYREPGSVLKDISYSLDWADPASDVCVRTRLAKEMAQSRKAFFQLYFEVLKKQLREEGVR